MQPKPSLYLVCGAALALGALLLPAAFMLHPTLQHQPLDVGQVSTWRLSLLARFVAAALIVAGMLALTLRFAASDRAGWALLALALMLVGAIGYLGGAAEEWSYLATGVPEGPDPQLPRVAWGIGALAATGRILSWLGLCALGVALTRDRAFPPWFGLLGIVIGVIEIAGEFLWTHSRSLLLLFLLGFAWLLALGLMMVRARARLGAPEPA